MDKLRSARRVLLVAGLAVTVMVGSGIAIAVAATRAPAGGAFRVFGSGNGLGGGGTVLLTGAIGDHGHSKSVDKAGKTSANGGYVKLVLSQGTLTLKKQTLDQSITKSFRAAALNKATCSFSVSGSGKLPITAATGKYAGATGSAHVTVAIGLIEPRFKSGSKAGKCNFSNSATPVSSRQIVYGTGHVNF